MSTGQDPADPAGTPPLPRSLVDEGTILDPVLNPVERERMGFSPDHSDPVAVMIELNFDHPQGLQGAEIRLRELWRAVLPDQPVPEQIGADYWMASLPPSEIVRLVQADKQAPNTRSRAILRVWPDFPVRALIYRSVATLKADAAQRAFAATGRGVTWAVVDSGIDMHHPHFRQHHTLGGDAAELHRDFTAGGRSGSGEALVDRFGHGTHVAGIIAGRLPSARRLSARRPRAQVFEEVGDEQSNVSRWQAQVLDDYTLDQLGGMAPECKLVSLKVLDDRGYGATSQVVRALRYVNDSVNANGRRIRIHGVNLSVGYEFDPKWVACGQSPLCVEVNRLVKSGVAVVVAAGNTGYGSLTALTRHTQAALTMTINDPGNARHAITVGATHRFAPHTYGVSYFSSKGPTADGRLKPDLVAPGEQIVSCATGARLQKLYPAGEAPTDPGVANYLTESGTSMAAAHVSGALAGFLSIRPEFIGQAEEVKRIFLDSALSLERERYFEGHGLIDMMKAIQSV
jgi:subtilisin family serine protease